MYNYFALIGKVEEIRIDSSTIIMAVNKPFRNADGIYLTDFIKVAYWSGLENYVREYVHENQTISITGHIDGDGQNIHLVADKFIFLEK